MTVGVAVMALFLPMNLAQEYNKKKTEIEIARLRAFSTIWQKSDICGIPCKPLTAQGWTDLRLAENSMIMGGIDKESIYCYLYRVHRDYPLNLIKKAFLEFRIWRMLKTVTGMTKLLKGIFGHIQQAFDEAPEQVAVGRSERVNKMQPVEGIVGAIDEVASRYGMHPMEAMQMPLAQVFALQKAMRLATIPGYKLAEPHPLREIKTEYLKQKATQNGKS